MRLRYRVKELLHSHGVAYGEVLSLGGDGHISHLE